MTTTSPDQGRDAGSVGDQQAVRDVIEAYADRMRSADVAGIVDLYTYDAAVAIDFTFTFWKIAQYMFQPQPEQS
jgi:ketosteroid isomerase-like protein